MTHHRRLWGWQLLVSLVVGGAIACVKSPALAQNITLDGTLGRVRPLTGPKYNILQSDGQTVGGNLFHSFGKFNLDSGEIANFYSNSSIRNILARVTGGQSLINGLLQTVSGNVNLFLINPSGITFGPNAKLDVGDATRGSFVATTVDAILFRNGTQFSATNPGGPSSLLTIVGNPSGFLASLRPPQSVVSTSQLLKTYRGQSLLLLGGDVRLNGSTLLAPAGRVELGGVAGVGIVGLNVDGNSLHLSFPNNVARSDVMLTNGALVNVTGDKGSIVVTARNLDILGGSGLLAGIGVGGTADSRAGNIEIYAQGAVKLENESFIFNSVDSDAIGKGGDVRITTGSLSLTNGAQVGAGTFGQGNAGNIIIQAHDVSFAGVGSNGVSSIALSTVGGNAVGKGGNVEITTDSLSLTNGAVLGTYTAGKGDAGDVTITARSNVSFDGVGSNGFSSGVGSFVGGNAVGKGGNVEITTDSLSLTNGASLFAGTMGQGDAGNLTITARSTVSLGGIGSNGFSSGAGSVVSGNAVGKGGNVEITTDSLSLTNGAVLSTETYGQGNAGNITITARNAVSFDGVGSNGFSSSALSTVNKKAAGEGGNIEITAGSLSLASGAILNASTSGRGDAGDVIIQARDTVSFDGVGSNGFSSGAFSNVYKEAAGKGGNVEITAGSLSLTSGAQLAAATFGQGNAGNFTITTRNAISFDGVGSNGFSSGAFSTVERGAAGKGGDINITADSLAITHGAKASVAALGQDVAGNVEVKARSVLLDRGTIDATTASSNGGNITLQIGDLLLLRHGSLISTTAGTAQAVGNGGNITINTPFIVAVPQENSDITANAYTGKGGRVDITAQGVFGTQLRPHLTPLSDITASSQFGVNGTVRINTPGVDPSRGISKLPVQPADASTQIAQGCTTSGSRTKASEFVVTGRGGLPPTPREAFDGDTVLEDWGTRSLTAARSSEIENTPSVKRSYSASEAKPEALGNRPPNATSTNVTTAPISPLPIAFVEAQGWMYGPHGEVILTAAPNTTAYSPQVTPGCKQSYRR